MAVENEPLSLPCFEVPLDTVLGSKKQKLLIMIFVISIDFYTSRVHTWGESYEPVIFHVLYYWSKPMMTLKLYKCFVDP